MSLAKRVGGVETPLGAPQTFEAIPLGTASLPAVDRKALLAFEEKTGRLQRAVLGAVKARRGSADPHRPPEESVGRRARGRSEARRRGARDRGAAQDLQIELSGDSARREPERADASVDRRTAFRRSSADTGTRRRRPPRRIAATTTSRRSSSRRSCRSCARSRSRTSRSSRTTPEAAARPGLRPRPRLETGIKGTLFCKAPDYRFARKEVSPHLKPELARIPRLSPAGG